MNVQQVGAFVKSKSLQIIAIIWAIWLTLAIHNTREDLDEIYRHVRIMEDSVSASDHDQSQRLKDIEQTVDRMANRLPY